MKIYKNLILLVMVTAAFLLLLFLINQEGETGNFEPRTAIKEETIIIEKSASNYTIMVPKDVCEGCHMSGKPFIPQALTVEPHKNGGMYCLTCHEISHEKHPIDQNVTCEKCHGADAKKPAYMNGYIQCNDCHDFPDPLIPSKGNIITIHRPRGISCNTCHTDNCEKCHSQVGASERWVKRLNHFKVVAQGK